MTASVLQLQRQLLDNYATAIGTVPPDRTFHMILDGSFDAALLGEWLAEQGLVKVHSYPNKTTGVLHVAVKRKFSKASK